MWRAPAWLAAAALVAVLQSPASAQYFGRNKVQYRTFHFEVLGTEHFDIYFYPGGRAGVDIAARLAERWYARFERLFGGPLVGRQPLVLYASHVDFEQTNIVPDQIDEGTGGFTEPLERRIVLPLAGPLADTDHVLGHELVHAFQFDLMARRSGVAGRAPGLDLPLWFIEGMAEYLSLGPVDANVAMRVRDAARYGRLPSIHELDSPRIFPYQWGHAVLAYIGGRYGDDMIVPLLDEAITTGNVELAMQEVLGASAEQISADWHASIQALYGPTLALGTFNDATRLLIAGRGLGADFNVGPSLSPDGRWVAFLSARGVFSTDLYIADADTGRVVRRLTSTATDAHYSSVQFIDSAGTWDPTGERLAIGVVVAGRPALAIFEARTGHRERDVAIPAVDEILNPAWSPDGRTIAFTGMREGLTDLYLFDLQTASLRQLTDDPYADLQPAWSPDGRRLIFASDRFSSRLESLHAGDLQLIAADPETGALEAVPAFPNGKHINPHWSGDGESIYFLADPDGIPNVYRMSWTERTIETMAVSATGISGLTRSSPALTVASSSGRIGFSVFEDDQYRIYVRDSTNPDVPTPRPPSLAAMLPPEDRDEGPVARMLADPEKGLPPPQIYPTAPYKPVLALAGVSQPTMGVGVSRFGASVGGGIGFVFSDFLRNQMLATAVQVNSPSSGDFGLNDLSFQTAYLNQSRRWNWGIVGGQVPYVTGIYESGAGTLPDGRPVGIDRETLYRETQRSVSGVFAYPLDRSRRVELQGGMARTSFERISRSIVYAPLSQEVLADTTVTDEFAQPLDLATAAVAFVVDNASFGATSPVQGRRYRIELSSALGSVHFTGVTVDYRRYVMPVPFYTIALRVMHYGRYGDGADDARLLPVYVNNPGLVRGFDTVFYAADCPPTVGACRIGDPAAGSRVLVGNVEFRFPVLRPLGASQGMYGPVPVEIALFADSGVAWTARDKPAFAGGSRPALRSAGIAVRASLGLAVAEFDFSRPFQTPDPGWRFGFNLLPGW